MSKGNRGEMKKAVLSGVVAVAFAVLSGQGAVDVRTTDYPTISAAVAACAEKGGVTAKKVTQDVIAVSSRVYYGMPGQEVAGPNPQLTRIEGVTMRDVHCDWAKRAVTLLCDPDYPARDFRLENVVIDEVFENFVRVENVDGVKLDVTARKIHPDAHW